VGDDDVAVVGDATAVDHRAKPLVVDADHYTLGRLHVDVEASHRRTLAGPRAGGVDDVVGLDGLVRFAADLDTGDRAVADGDLLDGRVGQDGRTVFFGTGGVGRHQPRGVDDAVGDDHRPDDIVAEFGHPVACLVAVDDFGRDTVFLTAFQFGLEILWVVLG